MLKRRLSSQNNLVGWDTDRALVMSCGVSFPVKYLGSAVVEKGRGIEICEQAILTIKASARPKRRMVLTVRFDCIRAVGDDSQEVVFDQPIEKVSYCSPYPDQTKLFSYISRDTAARRWMCHSFYAVKDPGERICHAMGCAFTACMRKQQERILARNLEREKEAEKASRVSGDQMEATRRLSSEPAAPSGPDTTDPDSPRHEDSTGIARTTSVPQIPHKNIAIPRRKSSTNLMTGGLIKPPPGIGTPTSAAQLPHRVEEEVFGRDQLLSNGTPSPGPDALEEAIAEVERALAKTRCNSAEVPGSAQELPRSPRQPAVGMLKHQQSFDLSHLQTVRDADKAVKNKQMALEMSVTNPFAEMDGESDPFEELAQRHTKAA